MLQMFVEPRDVSLRLRHSVVMHEGVPMYIRDCDESNSIASPVCGGDAVRISNKDIDLTPLTIGNVQVGNYYVSTSRAPSRQVKQGLSTNNLKVREMPWEHDGRVEVNSHMVGNAIINRYPSYLECVRSVTNGAYISRAFSKEWGIGLDEDIVKIFYKNTPVGVPFEEDLTIFRKYHYLKEKLLGVLNGKS
jgi:hypothetical protein